MASLFLDQAGDGKHMKRILLATLLFLVWLLVRSRKAMRQRYGTTADSGVPEEY